MSDFWQETIQQAVNHRHHLHAHPELSWQEHDTARYIRDVLSTLNIPWRACASTGTLGLIKAPKKESEQSSNRSTAQANTQKTIQAPRHIALRGDIDALPINEQSKVSWQSNHQGCMHACGHDGHTAALLAVAAVLVKHQQQLQNDVTLIFQPAEEGGHGAREMIADGALEGVDEIYGWHNWPAIPFGELACPDALVMCGNGTFEIEILGKGGHASQPELCVDPVLAASAVHMALQQIVSRRISPRQPTVVSVTSIEAIAGLTVIPERAILRGSVRVADTNSRDRVAQLIKEITQATASAYGAEAKVNFVPRYNATINHPRPAQRMRELWQQQEGAMSLADERYAPVMASEDFSYYLNEIPGAFALVGADDGPEHQAPCHSPHYDFNDRLLPKMIQLFCSLAGLDLVKS